MVSDLNKLAKEIVENNQYMTVASGGNDKIPWVSPMAYTYDKDYNFYFISIPSFRHSKNFEVNKNVSFAIFDSHQLFGEGVGLQIEGLVEDLPYKDSIDAIELYFQREWPYGKPSDESVFKELVESKIYHLYKITPAKVWMNDPNQKVDARVEVKFL